MSYPHKIVYMDAKDISKLVEKYKNGTLSLEESDFLDSWYLQYAMGKPSTLNPDHLNENMKLLWDGIMGDIFTGEFPPVKQKKATIWPSIVIAASILVVSSFGIYYFKIEKSIISQQQLANVTDIKPGGNRAFLTLADGSKISLSDARNGELANQSGIEITKTADGQLIYKVVDHQTAHTIHLIYNTIETPKGGQFQINLPDGSKVWLNAASTLKYPVSFAFAKTRNVELNGEAYFEVARDKAHPFHVKTAKQEIEVLGTHFNINSYADDQKTKTTLLEGSVRVSTLSSSLREGATKQPHTNKEVASSLRYPRNDEEFRNGGESKNDGKNRNELVLKPGQQSILTSTTLSVRNVDTEEAVAWKDGRFMFKNESIFEVMKEISRWYNVEVIYKGDLSDVAIGGSVSKFVNISEVLEILELTGKICIKIEGRKITVTKLNEQKNYSKPN